LIHFYKRFTYILTKCLVTQELLIQALPVEDIRGLELLQVEDIQGQEHLLALQVEDIQEPEVLLGVPKEGDIQGQELLLVLQVEGILGQELLLVVDTQELEVDTLEHPLVEDIKELEHRQANMVEHLSPKWTLLSNSGSKLSTRTTVAKSMLRSWARLWPMET